VTAGYRRINSVKERGRVKQIYAALRSLGRGRSLYVLNSQPLQLLSHFRKPLTNYRSVKAIDGNACLAVALPKAGEANSVFPLQR
jgi:hypothetical protein